MPSSRCNVAVPIGLALILGLRAMAVGRSSAHGRVDGRPTVSPS
jgi:hypothetical protein